MVEIYYDIVFAVSVLLCLTYTVIWHKHFDVHITIIYVLVPIANLGYVIFANANSLEAVIAANKIIYIGGCFNILMIMLTCFSLCDIKLKRWQRMIFFLISMLMYLASLTVGSSDIFYKKVTFERTAEGIIFHKEYGFLHTFYYLMIIMYFMISIVTIIYSYFKKKQVSRKMIYLLFLPEAVSFVSFFLGRRLISDIELIPLAYDLALIVYLIIIYRLSLYDITDSAIDSLIQTGDTGLASFDYKYNYLGSNETAKLIMPEFNELTVDKPIDCNDKMSETILKWLKAYDEDETANQVKLDKGDKTYIVDINYLYDGRRRRGYQLTFKDDTKNQQYISLINSYNSDLKKEVAQKTAHIVEMHDNLVMSMATMVESRDNST
ncbi:MAG: hypothetical protein IJ740_12430, partial [Ruminococcus sp.]|nr:hypothetical protein [Ruminococcus sp.]